MRITDTHVYFWHGEFSNWHPSVISPNCAGAGNTYQSSEQAFMHLKAEIFGDYEIADRILEAKTPKEAKDLGRVVKNFDPKVWDCVKLGMMTLVNYYKFSQNPELKKLLLDTGDKILVEASPYDKVWGVGLSEDDDNILDESKWKGQNLLGKALMDVRKLLK